MAPKYEAAFTDVVAAATEVDELIRKTLPKLGEDFGQSVTALIASQAGEVKNEAEHKGSQEWTEKTTLDKVAETQNFTLTLSIAALIIGLGRRLADRLSGITGPVKAMTEAMKRLAGGDKSVAVPATENKDEISEMAKAVQVFKDNAIKVDRLALEAEEQKKQAEISIRKRP